MTTLVSECNIIKIIYLNTECQDSIVGECSVVKSTKNQALRMYSSSWFNHQQQMPGADTEKNTLKLTPISIYMLLRNSTVIYTQHMAIKMPRDRDIYIPREDSRWFLGYHPGTK